MNEKVTKKLNDFEKKIVTDRLAVRQSNGRKGTQTEAQTRVKAQDPFRVLKY